MSMTSAIRNGISFSLVFFFFNIQLVVSYPKKKGAAAKRSLKHPQYYHRIFMAHVTNFFKGGWETASGWRQLHPNAILKCMEGT